MAREALDHRDHQGQRAGVVALVLGQHRLQVGEIGFVRPALATLGQHGARVREARLPAADAGLLGDDLGHVRPGLARSAKRSQAASSLPCSAFTNARRRRALAVCSWPAGTFASTASASAQRLASASRAPRRRRAIDVARARPGEHTLQLGDGAHRIAPLLQHAGEQDGGLRLRRFAAAHAVQRAPRDVEVAPVQGHAQHERCQSVSPRIELDALVEGGRRLGRPTLARAHLAELLPGLGAARIPVGGLVQRLFGLFELGAIEGDLGEPQPGRAFCRFALRLGLVKLAGLVHVAGLGQDGGGVGADVGVGRGAD